MNQAFSRLVNRVFRNRISEGVKELPDLFCELGYRYTQGAIDSREAEGSESIFEDPQSPYVLAGGRIPHIWLIDENGKKLSSLDLVKCNFVLLTTEDESPWIKAATEQSIPIDGYVINASSHPYRECERSARDAWRLQSDEALLIRPDGIIAWRAAGAEGGHQSELGRALRAVLKQ